MFRKINKVNRRMVKRVSLTLFFCLFFSLASAASDTTPPTGSIKINNGATYTNSIDVTLNLSATDIGSGVSEMKFSNDKSIWSTPESYNTTKAWVLRSGSGTRKAYVKFKDNAGNWSKAYYDTIALPNQTPQVGTIVPSFGESVPLKTVTFTTTYSDSNGWQDIKEAKLLINTTVNGANCFYGYYNQNTNKLYLRNNADSGWLGGFSPGTSNNIIQNSYAKLDCSKTTVMGNNTVLTVNWTVTFKSAFIGTKNTYLYVKDDANVYSNWTKVGSWEILNQPPQITSIQPEDNSTFLAGARITIKINASDPDNDSLEYQFSIGGTIKQPWSSLNTYNWQTSGSDTGAVEITCEVKDPEGLTASKTITYHIINPTVQEILQKVADNYALINDKMMDVTITSQFNGETFGKTIYTRHYFKKPDKQRTDTFSTPERADSSRIEIQITIGPDVYFIDPLSHAQSHRNILTELNLTQEQLNQMDEIYHLQDFLNAHTLLRKDNPEDLAKGLVMLEVIPNTTHNIYSKLGMQINYFKGIKTKSLTYIKEDNQDKLKQSIEITVSQQMPNGAWVPKSQVKTLYLTDGNLIMNSNFENIQINTGLPDYLFNPEGQ